MPDIAGEILKGTLSVVQPGREAEGGPTGLDAASMAKVGQGRERGSLDLEIGGAPNRSKDDVAKMIGGIDAGLKREPSPIRRMAQRDEGLER